MTGFFSNRTCIARTVRLNELPGSCRSVDQMVKTRRENKHPRPKWNGEKRPTRSMERREGSSVEGEKYRIQKGEWRKEPRQKKGGGQEREEPTIKITMCS